MRSALSLSFAAGLLSLGCSSNPSAAPRFELTPGHETDPWQVDPKPATARVTHIAEDGTRTGFLDASAPLAEFDIESSGVARYEIEGLDASGASRVFGRSLLLDQATFVNVTLPLFFGRRHALARPPGELTSPGDAPAVTLAAGRSLIVAAAAGSDGIVGTERYDFGAWAPVPRRVGVGCAAPGCRFDTLASVGSSLVFAVGSSSAVWFDLSDGSSGTAPLPTGLASYAEIDGGRAITGPDGTAYVVGATRPTGETSAVLVIAPDGTLSVLRLTAPRAGAAVTWLDGLVVVGGNARAAGAERWVVGGTGFAALGYPPDATVGAALVALDAHSVARLGGTSADGGAAPGVSLAVDCSGACTTAVHSPALGLTRATAVGSADDVVIAGTDAAGATAVVELVQGVAKPVALREPRTAATAVDVWSLGQLALVGGHHSDGSPALSVELFVP